MDKRLKALLVALKVPDPEWWNAQPVEAISELGKCISEKACGKSEFEINAAERLTSLVDMN